MAQNTVYITINNGQNSTFICPTTPVVNILASGGIAALGFTPEDVANKATDFTTLNNTLYPTTQAVENEIYVNMYFSQTPTF